MKERYGGSSNNDVSGSVPDFLMLIYSEEEEEEDEEEEEEEGEHLDTVCEVCERGDDDANMLLCDHCDRGEMMTMCSS